MIWVGDPRYDHLSNVSLPKKGQICYCFNFHTHDGISVCQIKGMSVGPNGRDVLARVSALREIDSEKLINKHLAGIGIERIKRECEPSRITVPQKEEA